MSRSVHISCHRQYQRTARKFNNIYPQYSKTTGMHLSKLHFEHWQTGSFCTHYSIKLATQPWSLFRTAGSLQKKITCSYQVKNLKSDLKCWRPWPTHICTQENIGAPSGRRGSFYADRVGGGESKLHWDYSRNIRGQSSQAYHGVSEQWASLLFAQLFSEEYGSTCLGKTAKTVQIGWIHIWPAGKAWHFGLFT